MIGALALVHGDEKGLILPPRIAPVQVVIVPIWRQDEQRDALRPFVEEIATNLGAEGIRVEADWRDNVRPGFKYNYWELRGVPVRLEVGPRDLEAGQVVAVRRDSREKTPMPVARISSEIPALLEQIQNDLLARARAFREENTHTADSMEALRKDLDERRGFYWVRWCGSRACEDAFAEMGATIRLVPAKDALGGQCIVCDKPAITRVLVAKAY